MLRKLPSLSVRLSEWAGRSMVTAKGQGSSCKEHRPDPWPCLVLGTKHRANSANITGGETVCRTDIPARPKIPTDRDVRRTRFGKRYHNPLT